MHHRGYHENLTKERLEVQQTALFPIVLISGIVVVVVVVVVIWNMLNEMGGTERGHRSLIPRLVHFGLVVDHHVDQVRDDLSGVVAVVR